MISILTMISLKTKLSAKGLNTLGIRLNLLNSLLRLKLSMISSTVPSEKQLLWLQAQLLLSRRPGGRANTGAKLYLDSLL